MLGNCHPAALSTEMIEDFSNALLHEKQLSPKTVRDILTCLRSVTLYITKQFPSLLPSVDIVYPQRDTEGNAGSFSSRTKTVDGILAYRHGCM